MDPARARLMSEALVPAGDEAVRAALRRLGEPITLFGEDRADRRERLRALAVDRQLGAGFFDGSPTQNSSDSDDDSVASDDEYYTPGGEALLACRQALARYSLARGRIVAQNQTKAAALSLAEAVTQRRQINETLKSFEDRAAESGFARPVSAVRLSPNGQVIAAGDWSGQVRLLTRDLDPYGSAFECRHTGKIGGLAWINDECVISSGLEGDIHIWHSSDAAPRATLRGHEGRVCRVDVHATGQFAASASFDYTWRLWDLETQQAVLIQEGHSKEVFAIKFQQAAGALVASAGLDGLARVWDLRTGRSVATIDSHSREVYAVDFAPNGFQVATAGADNTANIFDLRQHKQLFSIPAHTKMVSDLAFYQGNWPSGISHTSSWLATSSYDGTVKLWSADNWALQHTLPDGERVLCVDVSGADVVTGRWDRCVKVWSNTN